MIKLGSMMVSNIGNQTFQHRRNIRVYVGKDLGSKYLNVHYQLCVS